MGGRVADHVAGHAVDRMVQLSSSRVRHAEAKRGQVAAAAEDVRPPAGEMTEIGVEQGEHGSFPLNLSPL